MPLYAIALIASILRYRLYYDSVLRYLPILIAYALLSEILGVLIRDYDIFQIIYTDKYHFANNFIYNIFDIVFYLFFFQVFYKILKNKDNKNIMKYGLYIYLAVTLVNPFIQNILIFPQIYASAIGSSLLVICISMFFRETFLANQKTNNLLKWMSIGLLVFNIFYPIIMLVGRFDYDFYKKMNFQQLHYFLIVAMYSCFIIGFLKMGRMKPIGEDK